MRHFHIMGLAAALLAVPSAHALEAVAQGGVGSGSAMAANNLIQDSKIGDVQAGLAGTNLIVQQLQQQVAQQQQQISNLSNIINNGGGAAVSQTTTAETSSTGVIKDLEWVSGAGIAVCPVNKTVLSGTCLGGGSPGGIIGYGNGVGQTDGFGPPIYGGASGPAQGGPSTLGREVRTTPTGYMNYTVTGTYYLPGKVTAPNPRFWACEEGTTAMALCARY